MENEVFDTVIAAVVTYLDTAAKQAANVEEFALANHEEFYDLDGQVIPARLLALQAGEDNEKLFDVLFVLYAKARKDALEQVRDEIRDTADEAKRLAQQACAEQLPVSPKVGVAG